MGCCCLWLMMFLGFWRGVISYDWCQLVTISWGGYFVFSFSLALELVQFTILIKVQVLMKNCYIVRYWFFLIKFDVDFSCYQDLISVLGWLMTIGRVVQFLIFFELISRNILFLWYVWCLQLVTSFYFCFDCSLGNSSVHHWNQFLVNDC